jgi:hypothetical protein
MVQKSPENTRFTGVVFGIQIVIVKAGTMVRRAFLARGLR